MNSLLYSVRTRVFLVVLGAAAVSVAAYLLALEPLFADMLLEHEVQQVYSAAKTTAQALDVEIELAVRSLESVARLDGFSTLDRKRIGEALAVFDATTPFFIYTWALDSEGTVIAAPSLPDRVGEDRSSRDYFLLPTPQEPTHIQKVQISGRGRFSLAVGTVIFGEDGGKAGVVAGSLGLMDRNPQLYRAVLDAPFPDPYQVFLVNSGNMLLAHSDKTLPQPSEEGLESLGRQPFMEYLEAGKSEARSITFKGKKYTLGFAKVPFADWTVIVQVPDSFVARSVGKMTRALSTLLGVLLLAVLSVGLFLADRISNSLGVLTMALRQFGAQGKVHLPAVRGRGEIEDALQAFSSMVADRQKAESMLQESERRFRTLVDHAADGFFLHDFEGRILDVNQRACDSLGYSREELLTKTVADLEPLSETDDHKGVVWDTLKADTPVTVEGLHRRKDGTTFPVEVRIGMLNAGEGRFILALARDITERKKAEESLRESEEKYQKIFNNTIDAVTVFDIETKRLLDVNEAWLSLYGYSREEALRLSVSDVSAEPERSMKAIHESSVSGDTLIPVRHHRKKDGTKFWVELSAGPFTWKGRKVMYAVIRDITERKKAEEILQAAKDSLERQNEELRKIDRIKDGLLRDVSHELKTPVAKYAMQLEILRPIVAKYGLTAPERRAFAVMEESLRRQEGVIKSLLDLSRLEEGGRKFTREPLRLDELIGRVAEDYRHLLEGHGGEIAVDVPPVTISSDGEMLWHLFSNLFSNAIKFRKKEGALRISVGAETADGSVTVRVADEGVGFSGEEMGRAFERFYQSTASNEGSGVGLTICRMIVDGIGGRISLHSEGKGRGAKVSVTLPTA